MNKIFILLFVLFFSLDARDNPFFPLEGEEDLPLSSNLQTSSIPLKRASITLPSTARIIEGVTVKYKNLDGSIAEKSIVLQNSIDWHLPLFISQNYASSQAKTADKTLKKSNFEKIASLKFMEFYKSDKELKIITKDTMIRNFLLVKPHRIVVDFKRDIDIRSFEKYIKNSPYTKIRLGNHNGYYRVVIELDGYYRYKLTNIEGGFIFKLL